MKQGHGETNAGPVRVSSAKVKEGVWGRMERRKEEASWNREEHLVAVGGGDVEQGQIVGVKQRQAQDDCQHIEAVGEDGKVSKGTRKEAEARVNNVRPWC